MIKIKHKSQCAGCSACFAKCPRHCIEMKEDAEGFLYPFVHEEACTNCGLCERICPALTKTQTRQLHENPPAFAACAKDEIIRRESSSGGVFSVLAQSVLAAGGVVFGAGFDMHLTVRHIAIETVEELPHLRTSKYVQSVMGDAFTEAKVFLQAGRRVLFTGTPCQINGLYAFLGKEYENLLTMDFICHGVPSDKLWKSYLAEQAKRKGSPAQAASFRDKTNGWKRFSMCLVFADGGGYLCDHAEDPYMRAFLKNLSLRPSCYACAAKGENRRSDITVADLWGADKLVPDMNDDGGLSLVLLNTAHANAVWKMLSDALVTRPTDATSAIRANSAFLHSSPLHPNRDRFMKRVQKGGWSELAKCERVTLFGRVKRKIKQHLRKQGERHDS